MKLLGKKASFTPAYEKEQTGRNKNELVTVTGRITYVNRLHGWFCVSYRAGQTILRECFKLCEIDEAVTVHGK